MTIPEAIERFRQATKPFAGTWRGIEVKWVATKSTPSDLLAFQGLLTIASSRIGVDLLSDSNLVEARWETLEAADLANLFDQIARGFINLGGVERHLEGFDNFGVVKDFSGNSFSFEVDRPNIWLRAYGGKEIVNQAEIDRELKTLGFQGLYEATKDTLGFFVGGGTLPHFYLVAPVYIRTRCSLSSSGLKIEIRAHKELPLDNIAVSYRISPNTVRDRYQFGPGDVTSSEDDFYHLSRRVAANDAQEARVWTFYEGASEPLQHNWPRREDASIAASAEVVQAAMHESVLDPERVTSTDVFIVHGRDNGAKETVARFLQRLGLNPVILHEQPDRGLTIVEKLENYSNVGFAVVLLTPDDVGHQVDLPQDARPRARQNVIFELGYFLGKLGRDRVRALYWRDVEIPTDFAGVLFIPFGDGGAWRLHLARELRAAGLPVDLNNAT